MDVLLIKRLALAAVSGLLTACVLFVLGSTYLSLSPFERAIAEAFDGNSGAYDRTSSKIMCKGFDCPAFLEQLPPVSDVRCVHNMALWGACCVAEWEGLGTVEVHVYWSGPRYKLVLTEPRVRKLQQALAQPSMRS